MPFTFGEIVAALAMIGTLYSIWNQRRFVAMQAEEKKASADSSNVTDALRLKAEMKADMAALRLELESAQKALDESYRLIADLRDKDRKREREMSDLMIRFERDALLRANIEETLKLANEKIKELNERVRVLETDLDSARKLIIEKDRLIAELQSNSGTFQAARPSGFGTK
jgi:chromosome segregation ATPase